MERLSGSSGSGSTSESAVTIYDSDETWSTCRDPLLERPFAPFGDQRDYVMAPGGSFENASAPGWRFSGGAKLMAGDDPFGLRAGERVLRLPDDATAITPAMCVDLHYPTLRLAARSVRSGRLEVEVIYPDVPGAKFQEVARVEGGNVSAWLLSNDVPLYPGTGGVAPGERRVALRFTGQGNGDWHVDDVLVDPRYR